MLFFLFFCFSPKTFKLDTLGFNSFNLVLPQNFVHIYGNINLNKLRDLIKLRPRSQLVFWPAHLSRLHQ